ncbi:MAG: uncharacterized protein JWL71_55 [Acidobacteria bacterium]|nr:uncharacterized protein [Acidobacteriota bacterium]
MLNIYRDERIRPISHTDVSEFRIEKRRAEAALTLTTGPTVTGCFFLSGSSASHSGPERVADLLNAETGFFPFELNAGSAPHTVLYNRTQLLLVTLLEQTVEAQLEPGYTLATERAIRMLMSNGHALVGRVRIYRPSGRDRLSDYARAAEIFRYVETAAGTVIVNADHIVELRETNEA